MFRWANNGWIKSDKQVPENLDLIQAYYDHYEKGYRIDLVKVRGHSGNKWNEMADGLATGRIPPMKREEGGNVIE
jgi:ribonuclease HI